MNSPTSGNNIRIGDRYSTLPLAGARSKVYSDKQASVSLTLMPHSDVNTRLRNEHLVAAVTAVLARYDAAESVALGVCQGGVGVAISLPTPSEGTLESLTAFAAAVLNDVIWEPDPLGQQISVAGLTGVIDRNPLFGVLVALDYFMVPALRQDITLRLDDGALVADYNARLFPAETVERFLAHVSCMIVSLEQTPFATISSARMLNAEEEGALLALASGGEPAFDGTMQDLLAAALVASHEYPAVEFGDQSWSLREVVDRADEIGAALSVRIRSKGARIGIALLPGLDLIAALIATIRNCGVIVPLDTTLPAARQAAIRDSADLTAIVTEDRLAENFGETDLVIVEHLRGTAKITAKAIYHGIPTPDDPLYLMYTSGSTGLPKGVLVPHRTLANLITYENRRRSTFGKRTLGRTSIAFDVGIQEIFATILFGGTLVIATESERADVGALPSLLRTRHISRVYLPPVALQQMTEFAGPSPTAIESLEEVVVAGEQLRISPAVRRFFRATPARLINQYGPTETHVVAEAILDQAPLRWPDLPGIGRPLPGVRVYIVNAAGQLSPILVAGELLVGGVAPALGYVGLPDLSPARFVRDPFSENSEDIVYRTGDRARWLSDGRLEFLGREDDQVKIRGYRVELGDLEANAERLPGVRQAAAKYWASETWTGLALYLVPRDGREFSLRESRDALRDRVPEYMMPPLSAMMVLDELPVSTSGKVDRAQLPRPSTSEGLASGVGTLGERVAEIWTRRIGLGPIDQDDDFLDLGGHSLIAIQIVSEVNDSFNIGVPLSTLLRGTSLREFTKLVETLLVARAAGSSSIEQAAGRTARHEPTAVAFNKHFVDFVDLPGGRFAAISAAEARHLWIEICVQHAYRHAAFRYRPGSTVIDVGANIGIFSRYALQETGGCRLIAVEPAVELFSCLRQNLAEVEAQMHLLQLGCGMEDVEDSTFWFFPHVPSMSSFAPDRLRDKALLGGLLANNPARSVLDSGPEQWRFLEAAFEPSQRKVRRRKISTIFTELNVENVDLLKIDVQRGEQDVLRGIESDDWRRISNIVIELQDTSGGTESTVSLLKSVGFTVDVASIALHRGTDIRFVYGWRS